MPDNKPTNNQDNAQPEEYGAFQVEEREADIDEFEVDDSDGDGGEGAYNEKKN